MSLVLSCVIQPVPIDPDPYSGEDQFRFMASIEQRSFESGSSLDGMVVTWSSGDRIRVFNSQNPSGVVFTLRFGVGETEGTFGGPEISGEGPFFIVYPASIGGALSEENVTAVNIPDTKQYDVKSSGLGVSLAAGRGLSLSESQPVMLRHLDALLRLPVKGAKKVSKIHLYTNGNEMLCGTASISIPTEGVPSLAFDTSLRDGNSRRLTVNCNRSGTQLSIGGTNFYFSVPPGSFSQGYYLEVLDTEHNAMPGYGAAPASVKRNSVGELASVLYTAKYKAAFLLPELISNKDAVEAGGFTGVQASDVQLTPVCPYVRGLGQYAFSTTDDTQNMRVQDWTRGFSLNIGVPLGEALVPGEFTEKAVSVTPYGNTGAIAPESASMLVLKNVGNRIWLADGTNGYIVYQGD